MLSADEAAHVESHMNNQTTVNVSGDWNIADSMAITAIQNDRSNTYAYAVRGGVGTCSGTTAENDIKGNTNVTLNGNITANDVQVLAKNVIQTGDAYTYTAKGDNYSTVNIQGNVATMTVEKQTAVKIDANVTTDKYQTYEALTEADLANRSVVECIAIAGDGFAITDTTTTVTDTVTLGQGKMLKTNDGTSGSDITLAASDTLDITSTSDVDIPASAVSGAEAYTDTIVKRNNTVTINGNIQSKNDINLYAGKDADGNDASLTMDTAAETYNHSVIPIAEPELENELAQHNQVIVSNTAKGESVRHININAVTGQESIREMTGTYTWYGGGTDQDVSYVGTSEGTEVKNKRADNFARIDGSLTTGMNKTQTIVIGGYVAPPNNQAVEGGDSDFTITLNGVAMEGATVSTMNYGNMLFDRYQEVTALMNEYQGKYEVSGSEQDLSAYLGYKAEQERIWAQMERAGLLVTVTNGTQTKVYPIEVNDNLIYVVQIPDIVSSGGNLNITADNLYGSGTLLAQGAPQIDITNNSSAYLKLGDLTIGEIGGELFYNGNSIAENDKQAIRNLNRDQSKSVAFTALETDDPSGHEATINVLSTNIGKMTVKSTTSANSETHLWTPLKTIEINGMVSNMLGNVSITNEAGDIVIQGDTTTDSAGIEAKTISLSATGAVAQGYTDGIVNIGGDPEELWASMANKNQTEAKDILENNGLENEKHGTIGDTFYESRVQNGSWIVGGEVYINASDININGTIQSGFSQYQVSIDDDAITDIDYNDNSKVAYINGRTVYKINNGNRAVLQQDGTYTYEVQAYYDPKNDKIIVDDITPNGGKIYLTGRIASTGNGKIIALDDGANIDIVSTAGKTLEVGAINNEHVDGLIRITDLNQMTETEYTRTSRKVIDLVTGDTIVHNNVDNTTTQYTVKDGLRYNWTTGTETTEERTYHEESTEDWWGLGGADTTTELENYEKNNEPTETTSGSGDKLTGAYIDIVDEIGVGGKDYVIIYDNDVKTNERSEVEMWKSTSGFLGWYHTTHYRWTVTTGSSQTYQHSIKADHDIGIGFIEGDGQQSIDITGAQDVKLGGTIINTNDDSWLNVTSGGAITQNDQTWLLGNHINMNAQTGIQGIDVSAKNNDSVEALLKTDTGNIEASIDGTAAVNKITTGQGTINLSRQAVSST